MDLELYLYCKIQKMNAWCIRPMNWAGVWNKDKELCEGNFTALFNTEQEAKKICEQLNQAYYKEQIIREAREYVENHSLYEEEYDYDFEENIHLSGISDITAKKELLEILDRNVK